MLQFSAVLYGAQVISMCHNMLLSSPRLSFIIAFTKQLKVFKETFLQHGIFDGEFYTQGVQRKMVLVVNFFDFLKLLFFALLLLYLT